MVQGPNLIKLSIVASNARKLRKNCFPSLSETYVPGEGGLVEAFIIGEAPGAQEEVRQRPFIGPAGIVLRDLMKIADLRAAPKEPTARVNRSSNCWLTNVVKFRPPRNRKPTTEEIKAFRKLLQDEWRAVGSPALIIPVGGTALEAVTGGPSSILRAAGKCHAYTSPANGRELYVWPMVHPSFALRSGPQVQSMLEEDWDRLAHWRKQRAEAA